MTDIPETTLSIDWNPLQPLFIPIYHIQERPSSHLASYKDLISLEESQLPCSLQRAS